MDNNMEDPWNFHQCKLCNFKTRFLNNILRHVRQHRTRSENHRFVCDLHSPENYQCEKCEFESDLKMLSTEHFDSIHKTKQTEHYPNSVLRSCENCDFQTYSSLVLLRHDNRCTGNVPVKDENSVECGNGNTHSHQLTHDTNEEGDGFFHCSHCSYKTIHSKSLRYHVLQMHTSSDEPIIWFNNEKLKVKEQQTNTKHALRKHILSVHNELAEQFESFKCEHCPFETKYKGALKTHMLWKHSPLKENIWFQCNKQCSYKTKRKNALRKHMLIKHNQLATPKRHKCDHCPYEATRKNNLEIHMRHKHWFEWYLGEHKFKRHTNTVEPKELKYFTCNQCSYKTIRKDRLKAHILWEHTPSKQINSFKCELCSYISNHKGDLGGHILAQHMESENAQVFYEGVLVSQKHTPTEEINCLKCELCSYKSKHKDDLGRHILTQHMETEKAQVFYEGVLISL